MTLSTPLSLSLSKTRYKCQYCGVHEILETLRSWELSERKCPICNHSKFDLKPVPSDVNYYEGDPVPEEDGPEIGYGYD